MQASCVGDMKGGQTAARNVPWPEISLAISVPMSLESEWEEIRHQRHKRRVHPWHSDHLTATGKANQRLQMLGRQLGACIQAIIGFLTYATDITPYSFNPWSYGSLNAQDDG